MRKWTPPTPPRGSAGSIVPKRPKWRSTCQAMRSETQTVASVVASPYCHYANLSLIHI